MTVIRISTQIVGPDRTVSVQALLRKWNAVGRVLSMKAEERIRITKTFIASDDYGKKDYETEQEAYVDFSIIVSIKDSKVELMEGFEIPRETTVVE